MKKLLLLSSCLTFTAPMIAAHCAFEHLETKKASASTILGGLANVCAHGGMVVGAQDVKQQQQAVLNLASSVLFFAAELAQKTPKNQDKQRMLIEDMTNILVDHSMQEATYRSALQDSPHLRSFLSLPNKQDIHNALDKIFESKDQAVAFMGELFTATDNFITAHGLLMIAGLHDILGNILASAQAETQHPATEPTLTGDETCSEICAEEASTTEAEVERSFRPKKFIMKNNAGQTVEITISIPDAA